MRKNRKEGSPVRFGICTLPDNLPLLIDAGYDYIEPGFARIAALSAQDFAVVREAVRSSPLRAETFNSFFPADMCLYDDGAPARVAAYCANGFARAAELGGQIAVIGSGRARTFPADMDPAEGEARFCAILRICGDAAQQVGMRVAIEPLQASECGYIHTVAEALAVCRAADHAAVGVLADFFHIYRSGESLDALREADDRLFHLHLARPNPDRAIPTETDLDGCRPWADCVRAIGYTGRISLEGKMRPDLATAITAVRPVLDLFR